MKKIKNVKLFKTIIVILNIISISALSAFIFIPYYTILISLFLILWGVAYISTLYTLNIDKLSE